MHSLSSSAIGSSEDVVQALLEHLVEPLLPLKSSVHEIPSLSQQQMIAKQIHAVVLLYNYYQRKSFPELEFLNFESFCKLAVILEPNLMAHMNLMRQSDYTEVDDLENQLSLAEKAIMDACEISMVLNSKKDNLKAEGWPICKVAVLLIDSREDTCFLLYDSPTYRVWSVIEKGFDIYNMSSESTFEGKNKNKNKRKRIIRRPTKDGLNADDTVLQQLAISAVKEASGINPTDLVVLESHDVYSISKEKSAARLYIMQCSKLVNEDIQIPLKDTIEGLHGPLVEKISGKWRVTPVVEYFHVLPYAEILCEWFSRKSGTCDNEALSNDLEAAATIKLQHMKNPCNEEIIEERDRSKTSVFINDKASAVNSESPKQRHFNGFQMTCLSNPVDVAPKKDVDDSFMVYSPNEDMNNNNIHYNQKMTTSMESNEGAPQGCINFKETTDFMMTSRNTVCRGEKSGGENGIGIFPSDKDGMLIEGGALVACEFNPKMLLASKENALSGTALNVLLHKREKLVYEQRCLGDEIALCDKKLHTILYGGEDDLAVKIEAIIDGCNDVSLEIRTETQDERYQHLEGQGYHQYMMKRLSEAVLNLRSPCQELDDICYKWVLPTYHVSPSDAGFLANVTLKGPDFEFSEWSNVHAHPHEARESAAAKMIAKLQNMVTQTNSFQGSLEEPTQQ